MSVVLQSILDQVACDGRQLVNMLDEQVLTRLPPLMTVLRCYAYQFHANAQCNHLAINKYRPTYT